SDAGCRRRQSSRRSGWKCAIDARTGLPLRWACFATGGGVWQRRRSRRRQSRSDRTHGAPPRSNGGFAPQDLAPQFAPHPLFAAESDRGHFAPLCRSVTAVPAKFRHLASLGDFIGLWLALASSRLRHLLSLFVTPRLG